jgi:hypothetical protein
MTREINERLSVSDEPLVFLDYGAGSPAYGRCLNIIEVNSLRRAYYIGNEASRCKFYGTDRRVVVAPWMGYWHAYVFGNGHA